MTSNNNITTTKGGTLAVLLIGYIFLFLKFYMKEFEWGIISFWMLLLLLYL